MNTTRRPGRRAVVGVLAVVVVGVLVGLWYVSSQPKDSREVLARIALTAPDSDIRADLLAYADEPADDLKPSVSKLREGVKEFPDSARLHLRLGTALSGEEAAAEFREVTKLDPANALPMYMLASDAAAGGHWDEVSRLLAQADSCKRMDSYRLDMKLAGGKLLREVALVAAANTHQLPVYEDLRTLSRNVARHGLELHEAGKSREAARQLAMIERMGWKLIESGDATVMDATAGAVIVMTSQKIAEQVYLDTVDGKSWDKLQKDRERLNYIRAGTKWYMTSVLPKRMKQGRLAGTYQEEQQLVRDLVAGRLKVPQKFIREAEEANRPAACAPGG